MPFTKTEQQEQQQGEKTKTKQQNYPLAETFKRNLFFFFSRNAEARAEHIYLQLIIPPSIINRCIRPSAVRALDSSHPYALRGRVLPICS